MSWCKLTAYFYWASMTRPFHELAVSPPLPNNLKPQLQPAWRYIKLKKTKKKKNPDTDFDQFSSKDTLTYRKNTTRGLSKERQLYFILPREWFMKSFRAPKSHCSHEQSIISQGSDTQDINTMPWVATENARLQGRSYSTQWENVLQLVATQLSPLYSS